MARKSVGWQTELAAARPIRESTGWSCACTRPRSPPPIAPTAPTWASDRNGCRCSTATRSTWWSAVTSTTTNARIRSGERKNTETKTPIPVETRDDVIDTSKGTVHLVIGGGGTSAPSNTMFFPNPNAECSPASANSTRRSDARPRLVVEDAPWSAFRDPENPYGFVAFDVDPGQPGGNTSIKATHYAVKGPMGRSAWSNNSP